MADAIYVPKSDILDLITEEHETGGFTNYSNYSDLWDEVDDMPAADVQPVKHGSWIPSHPVDVAKEFKCTACQGLVCLPVFAKTCYYDFCPNCGARMGSEQLKDK